MAGNVQAVTVGPSAPTPRGEHTSTFPVELAARCIVARSPSNGHVLAPFAGSGTTGMAAVHHGRTATLIELSPEHAAAITMRVRCS